MDRHPRVSRQTLFANRREQGDRRRARRHARRGQHGGGEDRQGAPGLDRRLEAGGRRRGSAKNRGAKRPVGVLIPSRTPVRRISVWTAFLACLAILPLRGADWVTHSGDYQRTGWQKNETAISK